MLKRNAAIILIAGLVVGGGALAYAEGSPSRPTVSTAASGSASAQARAGGRAHRPGMGILRRTVHGDLVVRGQGQFQNVTFDRGKLTAKDGNTLTIARPDGVNVTVTVTDSTKYRGVSGLDELQTGRPTVVVSKDGQALMVGQRDGARASGTPATPAA